jgi:hypothetical protein
MTEMVLDEFRAKQLEKEALGHSMQKRPTEVSLQHGEHDQLLWGRIRILRKDRICWKGVNITRLAYYVNTRKFTNTIFLNLLPEGKGIESIQRPTKYLHTVRGSNLLSGLVLGGGIFFDILWVAAFSFLSTLDPIAVILHPVVLAPLCVLAATGLILYLFRDTFTCYRLSLECILPNKEPRLLHFCYATHCGMSAFEQAAWLKIPLEDIAPVFENFAESLNEELWHLEGMVGKAQMRVDNLLREKEHNQILEEDRAGVKRAQKSLISTDKLLLILGVALMVAIGIAAVIFGGK